MYLALKGVSPCYSPTLCFHHLLEVSQLMATGAVIPPLPPPLAAVCLLDNGTLLATVGGAVGGRYSAGYSRRCCW